MMVELMFTVGVALAFANSWVCVLMSFGTTTSDTKIGLQFMVGRFFGLIVLGMAISLLRFPAQDYSQWLLLVFGTFTIAFGGYFIYQSYVSYKIDKEVKHGGCSGPGDGSGPCGKHKKRMGAHEANKDRRDWLSGVPLGILRGATPCVKIMFLAPLLIAVDFFFSLVLIVVFAAVSTIYPLIGYLSGRALKNLKSHRLPVQVAGASIMIGIGIYTLYKVVLWDSIHGGGFGP